MGEITIAGTAISDATAAFAGGVSVPIVGTYYPTGDPPHWGEPPCAGPYISARVETVFGGLDHTGIKDFGKRKRVIYADLLFFAALTSLRANVKTRLDAFMTNTRYSIILNGETFQGCKLNPEGVGRGRRIWSGGAIVGEMIPLIFMQYSDTN